MRLPLKIERYLEDKAGTVGIKKLKSLYDSISNNYRLGSKQTAESICDDAALAYTVARMPATCEAMLYVFRELRNRLPNFQPTSLIDLGAGPASSFWATIEAFPTINKIYFFERATNFVDLGKDMLALSDCSNTDLTWMNLKLDEILSIPPANIALFSYSIGELNPTLIHKILTLLCESIDTIVIVEPGTPQGFENILLARDFFLSRNFSMIAPCPHKFVCPLSATPEWCHFSVRLERSSLHRKIKGELPYEDEKFSYLIMSKEDIPPSPPRIISLPRNSKAGVTLDLCYSSGKREFLNINSRDKESYKKTSKLKWGDIFYSLF